MSARWPAQLTASAFNRLGQYASSPGYRAYCHTELAVFSLVMTKGPSPVFICTYPRRVGQAESTWVAD